MIEHCLAKGINPGYRLSDDELLVAITEQRTRAQIDRLVDDDRGGTGMSATDAERAHARSSRPPTTS